MHPPPQPVQNNNSPENPKHQMAVDPELENGPIQKRSCTDIICWVIWIAALIFWLVSIFYGFGKGEPSRVFAPWDEDSKQCGYTSGYSGVGLGYFYTAVDPAYANSVFSRVICVSKCPTYTNDPAVTDLTTLAQQGITCKDTPQSAVESDNDIIPTYSYPTVMGCKHFRAYKSYAFLGSYCMPDANWVSNAASSLSGVISKLDSAFSVLDTVYQWIDDLAVIWPLILAGIGIAIFLGVFYCYFMRCCAGVMAWIMIILLLVIFWGGGVLA
jgi:choline transporter-like protein 2/4/5